MKGIIKRSLILCMTAVVAVTMTGCSQNVKITTGLKESVIFKLSDSECNLGEIAAVLVNEKNKYEQDLGIEIWEKSMGDTFMEDSVKNSVKDRQVYLEAMYMMAQEKGIVLSDEENDLINQAAKAYCDTLSSEEKDIMGVSEEDILSLYKKCYMSEKLYKSVTDSIQYEVSDEEARVMSVMYIYISSDKTKADEAFEKVKAGSNFYSVASEYSEDSIIRIELGRGDMVEDIEKAVFVLKPDEYTDIINTDRGYYIVKCVDDYMEDRTESNKEKILQTVKNETFLKEFEPFLKDQKLDFNDKVWDKIKFDEYEGADTTSLFDIYDEYL